MTTQETSDLALALQAGTTLLTVNNRLARHLFSIHEDAQRAAGRMAWPTPDILPLGGWLTRCHEQLLDLGLNDERLLEPSQELVLWERVIATTNQAHPLMRPESAANVAAKAYALLHGWQLAGHHELALSVEGEVLQQWIAAFERLCAQQRLLPAARLPERLQQAFAAGDLPLPAAIRLAGFDDLPPQQQQLFDTLTAAGCTFEPLEQSGSAGTPLRLVCTDPTEERNLAARWALTRLQANPQARIAIVCPDIQGQREPLRQQLTDTLAPDSLPPGASRERLPFNFSLGLSLADQPLVRDGLLALQLCTGQLSHGELNQLLRSPFLGGGLTEAQPRALFDAELRRRGFPDYNLHRLRQQATRVAPEAAHHCPDLFARLDTLIQSSYSHPNKAGTAHWARYFQALLADWGWPGERPLSSHEYQQNQAFNGLLSALAGLDGLSVQTGPKLAVQRLKDLARDTLFQPEGSDAPLQVLGVLEAAGQSFDHLWLLGLDDGHWPPSPAPNPLLPAHLQREHGMPHGSAERELAFARTAMDRLLAAAPEVIVSHAAMSSDGEQGPSPLISGWPVSEPSALALAAERSPADHGSLDTLDDWWAPHAPQQVAGGATLLADQAACPFRAFAHHRLLARDLEQVSHGPDPRLIGNQIHRILQRLWEQLKTQQALLALDPEQLHMQLLQLVSASLEDLGRERPDLYEAHFKALEQARLVELLEHWLALEKERAPFSVQTLEKRELAPLGPLTLKVQADRVDRLEDGRLVVIDYKTGRSQRTGTWVKERPEEPQIPLYAIHQTEPVAGAAIARLRLDRDGGFKGLAEDKGLLPGIGAFKGNEGIPDWSALIEHWRQQLTALAEEIQAGRADPLPGPTTCRYCELAALCRVALMDGEEANLDD